MYVCICAVGQVRDATLSADRSMPYAQVPSGANGRQPNDTWISGRNGGADISGRASQDHMNNEQLAAAQGQAGVSAYSGYGMTAFMSVAILYGGSWYMHPDASGLHAVRAFIK